MFTGIIETTGYIKSVDSSAEDRRIIVDTQSLDMGDVNLGDSISVNGVCLTVVEKNMDGFTTDVSTETLSCTTLGNLKEGDRVNLEKALQINDRLGGHLVSGHVDAIGEIIDTSKDARSYRYFINVPRDIIRYICRKGSVCVDGVSLTINEVENNTFQVNIIPHTMQQTIFSEYKTGTQVNIEVDIIARYLESIMREVEADN